MKKRLERILAMVLFFSFIFTLCIFVLPVFSADWSGVPSWNPGDGRDVIEDISVIEPQISETLHLGLDISFKKAKHVHVRFTIKPEQSHISFRIYVKVI